MKNVFLSATALLLAAGCAPEPAPAVVELAPPPAASPEPPAPDPPAATPRAPAAAAPAYLDALEALRDPRPRVEPRPTGQIVAEIQQNETRFAATQPGAPDRRELAHWLTREYASLIDAAMRDAAGPMGADGAARSQIDRLTANARTAEIKYLMLLAQEYPAGCPAPPPREETAMCPDGAMYLAAYESERAARLDDARKAYLRLIQSYPTSRLVPYAYLAFGELFLREAKQDPSKLGLAEQSYAEVRKYPPPQNEVYGYALLRLGEVYAQKGDPARARATWAKLRLYAEQNHGLPGATVPASRVPE